MRMMPLVLMMVILLTACSTPSRRSPAPVVRSSPEPAASTVGEAATVPPSAQDEGAEVSAYEPAVSLPMEVESGSYGQAVVALLANSEQQQKAGDTSAAVGTVERALRIEPRNAHLWNRLARLRFEQKRYTMASDLAAKSNSLAAGDSALKRQNWSLIAKARRIQGDVAGAREAELMARKK